MDAWLKSHKEAETELRHVLEKHFAAIAENVRERIQAGQPPADSFTPSEWGNELRKDVAATMLRIARRAAQEALEGDAAKEGADGLPSADDAVLMATEGLVAGMAVEQSVEQHLKETLWDEIHEGIAADIAEAVAAYPQPEPSIPEGEGKSLLPTLGDLARWVWDWLTGANKRRAANVATASATAALNAGAQAAGASTTKVMRKRWVAVMDDRTRDDHAAANGQEVGIDEPFIVGGSPAKYPGDPSLPIEQRIHCRCRSLVFSI